MKSTTEALLELAQSLYQEAKIHECENQEIAQRFVSEADSIMKDFGPVDDVVETPNEPYNHPEDDEIMQRMLKNMRQTSVDPASEETSRWTKMLWPLWPKKKSPQDRHLVSWGDPYSTGSANKA